MSRVGIETIEQIKQRIRACDYISVAELYLSDNFLLNRPLEYDDIKPRLLGHWGTCHGINLAYANLAAHFKKNPNFTFILGPGHGFPALQANLFYDEILQQFDQNTTSNLSGLAYLCRSFSWPDGFPSHASPLTPGVIVEGGELGYALANAYGAALGHPEKTLAVLIGDGELETATALASLHLHNLLDTEKNGKVLPLLHLNGYKISAPSIYARKSERELNELIRGFGFTPVSINAENPEEFQSTLNTNFKYPFYILHSEKGEGGPNRHHTAHQIPLKNPASNPEELQTLEHWLKSYNFNELFDAEKGFLK